MSPTQTDRPLIALGLYRISDDAGRSAAGRLHSDGSQIDAIDAIAARYGAPVDEYLDETNVSGDTPLDERPYGRAIARVEDPSDPVNMIIFAYRSRHDRSVLEGSAAIERMDRAGGVLVVGHEVLTFATPDQWFQATVGSVFSEYQKRQIAYLCSKGVERAVALGRCPYPSVPLGFELVPPHNTIKLAPERVLRVVRAAFEMRADGATIDAVRAYLAEQGHVRAYRAIQRMLKSSLYVGEIRYGGKLKKDGTRSPLYVNTSPGFDAIVDRDVWERVQSRGYVAGRNCKSERLLARQSVVHCGGCGGRMIAGTNQSPNGKTNTFYRCGRGRTSDCPARATIHAEQLEQLVSDAARAHLIDAEERESAVADAVAARDAAIAAERKYKRARRLLVDADDDVEDDEAEQQLDELKGDWKSKLALADQLEHDCEEAKSVNAARDWALLTIDERRRLIKAAIAHVSIRPGRGGTVAERATITLKRKQTARSAA